MTEPAYYTFQQACKILNVSPRTLRKAIAAGTIPAITVGPKTVRIPREAIDVVAVIVGTIPALVVGPKVEPDEDTANPYPWLGA